MSAKMKMHKGKVDIRDWNLNSFEPFRQLLQEAGEKTLEKAASEIVQLAIDSGDSYAYLPAEYGDEDGCGGPRCNDPLTVYFKFAVGSCDLTDPDDPVLKTSLGEMLEGTLDDCEQDGSYSDGLARIRDGLRALADRIDASIQKGAKSS